MKISNTFAAGFVLLFALTLWVSAAHLPNPSQQAFGPDLFPKVIAGFLVLSAFALLITGWHERGEPLVTVQEWARSPKSIARVLVIPVSVILFIALFDVLGFIVDGFLLLLLLFSIGGVRIVRATVIALVVVLLTHTIFYVGLSVPVSWGILAPIAW